MAPEGFDHRAAGGPVEDPFPRPDSAGRADGLFRLPGKSLEKTLQPRRLVGEDAHFAPLRGGDRALPLEEVLTLDRERCDPALLLPGPRVEPIGLRLQCLLPREPRLEPQLRPAVLAEEPGVAAGE